MAITRLGGANAITGTLPAANINDTSIGNITALPAAIDTGKVLQVVNSVSTSNANTSTQTYVSYLTASITPSSTSNKIFAVFTGNGYGNGQSIQVGLFRGGVSDTLISACAVYNGASGEDYETKALGLSKLDSPSTTSAQTYTIGFRPVGGNVYAQLGEAGLSTSQNLTLMEIAV